MNFDYFFFRHEILIFFPARKKEKKSKTRPDYIPAIKCYKNKLSEERRDTNWIVCMTHGLCFRVVWRDESNVAFPHDRFDVFFFFIPTIPVSLFPPRLFLVLSIFKIFFFSSIGGSPNGLSLFEMCVPAFSLMRNQCILWDSDFFESRLFYMASFHSVENSLNL